jgi:hypothetical protein
MFVGSGGEQKQNGGGGGQEENNNHHDEKRRWFLVCEADYMATNLNTGGPINLMREDPDQYYLSCDDVEHDDRDYTHSNGNNYSPFFYNHTSSNDLFHLRNRQSRLYYYTQQTTQSSNNSAATTNYSIASKFAKEK